MKHIHRSCNPQSTGTSGPDQFSSSETCSQESDKSIDKSQGVLAASCRTLTGHQPARLPMSDTGCMVDDTARDRAIYQALKAADEVAAALQTHLIEEHGADPDRAAVQSPSSNSLKLLRQARERLGEGLRAVEADHIAESDGISLRNR
jgi:hypothetical protein